MEVNQPFEAKCAWQSFTVDKEGEVDKASDFPTFRNNEKVEVSVTLPAKVEFVNYQELGYIFNSS